MYKIGGILEIWANATYNLDLIVINSLQRGPKKSVSSSDLEVAIISITYTISLEVSYYTSIWKRGLFYFSFL